MHLSPNTPALQAAIAQIDRAFANAKNPGAFKNVEPRYSPDGYVGTRAINPLLGDLTFERDCRLAWDHAQAEAV